MGIIGEAVHLDVSLLRLVSSNFNGVTLMTNKYKYGDPRNRRFTQIASELIGGHNYLGAGRCPTCGGEIVGFKDELSLKEFAISGMCQSCQDGIFSTD